tara:strand:- start:333 stop:986 length:654 start_codon:yes stop_codon:yes gene_type:complete
MSSYNEKSLIKLPSKINNTNWKNYLLRILDETESIELDIDCNEWNFSCKDIKEIDLITKEKKKTIASIRSKFSETIVSALALSFKAELSISDDIQGLNKTASSYQKTISKKVLFHQGTLRSGEILEGEEDVMILGDVNPGAKVCANENIMIWGRLLGTAHAGKSGNINSTISALQLRPLQLRIADKIARGPEEKPNEGVAEKACVESGRIIISPLKT